MVWACVHAGFHPSSPWLWCALSSSLLEKASSLRWEFFTSNAMNFSPHLEGEALEHSLPSAQAEICVRWVPCTYCFPIPGKGRVSTLWNTQSRRFKDCDYHFKVETVFNNSLNYREHYPTCSYLSVSGDHWTYLGADLCTLTHVFSFS